MDNKSSSPTRDHQNILIVRLMDNWIIYSILLSMRWWLGFTLFCPVL